MARVEHNYDLEAISQVLSAADVGGAHLIGVCGKLGCGQIVAHWSTKNERWFGKCSAEYVKPIPMPFIRSSRLLKLGRKAQFIYLARRKV